ncbi:MAG: hypothetical protein VKJ86_07045 [Synechococcus sp.]|nr:hypothetical protein [Synechococcus sp.]
MWYIEFTGVVFLMGYIEKVLEKLREWAGKVIETLLGPTAEPEPELIPIPVHDRQRRRY